uniref:Uncharacterized protein n=1 Tax=Romanomermis culicivorax TaxID=13658 RepID=A0A915HKT9_ROMCU
MIVIYLTLFTVLERMIMCQDIASMKCRAQYMSSLIFIDNDHVSYYCKAGQDKMIQTNKICFLPVDIRELEGKCEVRYEHQNWKVIRMRHTPNDDLIEWEFCSGAKSDKFNAQSHKCQPLDIGRAMHIQVQMLKGFLGGAVAVPSLANVAVVCELRKSCALKSEIIKRIRGNLPSHTPSPFPGPDCMVWGGCASPQALLEGIYSLAGEYNKIGKWADKSIVYKIRSLIYSKGDKFNANHRNYWGKNQQYQTFTTLFKDAAKLFENTHPEVHKINYRGMEMGAETFCTMALTYFPAAISDLYPRININICPDAGVQCYENGAFRYEYPPSLPNHYNLVYYTSRALAKACYIPDGHIAIRDLNIRQRRCITFDKAQLLLINKNNDNRNSERYKSRYMASIISVWNVYYLKKENGYYLHDFNQQPPANQQKSIADTLSDI